MHLLQKIEAHMREALKKSDALTVSVLRMAKADITNKRIEKGSDLTDQEIIAVLSTLARQRRESIEQFSMGGREDLARKEEKELDILLSYLPKQLSAHEIDALIGSAINEAAAKGVQDIGKVMSIVMPKIQGIADGKTVNLRARQILTSQ